MMQMKILGRQSSSTALGSSVRVSLTEGQPRSIQIVPDEQEGTCVRIKNQKTNGRVKNQKHSRKFASLTSTSHDPPHDTLRLRIRSVVLISTYVVGI